MKTIVAFFLCIGFSLSCFASSGVGYDLVWDIRSRIPADKITSDIERQIYERISDIDEMTYSEKESARQKDAVSIRSILWRMYDMEDYYTKRQIDKPVLGYIIDRADTIKALMEDSEATESLATLYILLDTYFRDSYSRYSIHLDRELGVRYELHQKALAELSDEAIIPTPGLSQTYQSIVIDLSDQKMYAFEDDTLVMVTPVTTGRRGFSTAQGDFSVKKKERNRYLTSPFEGITYKLHVDYWIQFYGDFGIHDACNEKSCWRKEFGKSDYTRNGSHGCVNTPYEAVEWLYNWSLNGTRVRVQA